MWGGAVSNALRASSDITSRVSLGTLRKGTLDAVKATVCREISLSAAYHRYALIAANLLLHVVSALPLCFRNSMYDNKKSCVQSSNPNDRIDRCLISVTYRLKTVNASRYVSTVFLLFNT